MNLELSRLRRQQDYPEIIRRVREAVATDRVAALSDWQVKKWCGLRWRNLFIGEASKDAAARKEARSGTSSRKADSDREVIARRFLRAHGRDEGAPDMPPAEWKGLENTTFVFCPGLLNGLLPVRAFQESLPEVERDYDCPVIRADLHPLAGCEANARDLAAAIEQGIGLTADRKVIEPDEATPPKDVFLMGYSKGMADIVTLLVQRPDLAPRIRCIFSWAGAAGGSYVADHIEELLKDVKEDPKILDRLIKGLSPIAEIPEIVTRRQQETDITSALRDLTTSVRQAFLEQHEEAINDLGIPIFNLVGSTTLLKAPSFQADGVARLNRYDSNNDMQVTAYQAALQMPMATHLALLNAHHWDLSYGKFPKSLRALSPNLDHPFPKKAALVANLLLAGELGLID